MTDPTVVLVSVGADSAALIDEIERKGLRVVSCPFAEAEEAIEREKPLLVVLHGARGALELSTMLEDAENPPQVAVVAGRADLGTLMGLNREIVVSLLATELTEKTVAARLEAVVRQRAKTLGLTLNLAARRLSLGPRPNLSRPPPSRPGPESKPPGLVLETPTPDLQSLARARALQPPPSDDKPSLRTPRVSSGTAIGLPAPGRPDAGPPPRRPPPRDQVPAASRASDSADDLSASELLSEIPGPPEPRPRPPAAPSSTSLSAVLPPAAAPPAAAPPGAALSTAAALPPRPAPPRPPAELVDSTIDSDAPTAVISLTPSVIESLAPREGAGPPLPIAPAAPLVPRFEPSELLAESGLEDSVGPDLSAALSLDRPPLSAGSPPPSAPLPLSADTDGLVAGLGPSGAVHSFPSTGADDEDDDFALPLLRPSHPPDTSGDDFSSTMLTEVTMPAIPGSLAAEALAAARLRSEPNHPIPEPFLDLKDPEDDRATVTGLSTEGMLSPPPASVANRIQAAPVLPRVPREQRFDFEEPAPKKPRTGLVAGLAVVAAASGAAAYVFWGMKPPSGPSVRSESPPAVAQAEVLATPPPVAPSEDPSGSPPSDTSAAPSAGDPSAAEAPSTPTGDDAPPDGDEAAKPSADAAGEPAIDAPAADPPVAVPPAAVDDEPTLPSVAAAPSPPTSTEPAVLLDNPFGIPDANLPGCDQLAPGARPSTADPVTEASTHWTAARKSIVKGDIEGASRAMCLAAAINPQSPAVEGLARLYTLAHSSAQALIWIERALAIAPSNRELLSLRGDAKSQLGQQDAATLDWLEAMGILPDETKRRTNQAAEYANIAREEKRSDLAKAEQFFRRALGFEETNLVALTGMAELLLNRKLYDQAGSFAVRALAVFEPVPEAYLVLGDVALAKNDPGRARASFERALAIRPDFWPAKTRLRDLPK